VSSCDSIKSFIIPVVLSSMSGLAVSESGLLLLGERAPEEDAGEAFVMGEPDDGEPAVWLGNVGMLETDEDDNESHLLRLLDG